MARLISIFIGLGFAFVAMIAFVSGLYTWATEPVEKTAEYTFHLYPKETDFSFKGPFGRWDVAQLQRGYKVYKEVCAACHSMNYVAFRDLAQLGYDEGQIKAEAANWQVPGVDPVTGEATTRPGVPTDYFPSPYPNDIAARAANNNAVPPDMSLITKARHDGTNYVASLLAGYMSPDALRVDGKTIGQAFPEFQTPPGLHFNPYFHSLNIAMAPPLTSTGQVTYDDGTRTHDPADVERCGGVPDLDRRTQDDRAQADRLGCAGLRAVRHRTRLSCQAADLGTGEAEGRARTRVQRPGALLIAMRRFSEAPVV